MSLPPPTPLSSSKRLRSAVLLNLLLPGAGQLYLGQRLAGSLLMALFLGCFAADLGVFLCDYAKYLNLTLGGNLLQGDRLERLNHVFQLGWMLGLLGAGLVIYVAALVGLRAGPPAVSPPPLPPPVQMAPNNFKRK